MAALTPNTVIDIGGSKLNFKFDDQLPQAFRHEGDFPKELAYTVGMDAWFGVAGQSYQTTDELAIIEATAASVVAKMPTGTTIIDLGAADSAKYEPYVREFFNQGKTCTYVPLDINQASLEKQVGRAKAKFPGLESYGLWGDFRQGDEYYANIASPRLFLSLGSIMYNGPDEVAIQRCQAFYNELAPMDRVIVGQDCPKVTEDKSLDPYKNQVYDKFFTTYLKGIHAQAGIDADATTSWSYESKTDKTMHYFEVVNKIDLTCAKFGIHVPAGTVYCMFKSWKRDEQDIIDITHDNKLSIETIGKAPNNGTMRQYMVWKQ